MKKLYFLMVTLLVTSLTFGQDLVITGIIDGPLPGGYPKGLELYVVNDIADLSVYGIERAGNGDAPTGTQTYTFPADSYTAGDFIYISAEIPYFTQYLGIAPTYADTANGELNNNGDDVVMLYSNGSLSDAIGFGDGTGTTWEYLDGWAYRIDGQGPNATFTDTEWTYSGINALDGCDLGDDTGTNAGCASVFPIGTYSPTVNTNPTISITSPNDGQALDSGTTDVDVEFTVANAPGATVNIIVIVNGGTPDVNNGATSPFTISSLVDGDSVTVTADLVDGGNLDSDMITFSIAYPCDLQVGTITETCDAITPATDDTYTATIEYTGGGTTTYTIDTSGIGTVGGDDPSSVTDGTITISDIPEGTDFSVSFNGNPADSSCSFSRNINSPDCDPTLPLPLYEGFDYTEGSQLIDAANWANISDSSDEVLVAGPGGLTYPNLADSNQLGNHVTFDGGGSDPEIQFTPVTSGAIYASFLINITDNASVDTPGYFAVLGGFDARLWTVPGTNPGEYQIGISNVNTAPTAGELDSTVLTTGTTAFIVMSYDLTTGTISAWVNPSDATFGGSAPTASASSTESGDVVTSFNQFAIRQDSTNETAFTLFDELRIGTSWADVTPTTLSIDDFSSNRFKVYPNPTSLGYVNIASANSEAISVTVFDILGKQVINETLSNNRLNVSALNTGVYIMKVTQNNASVTKKLIIK
ncbi:T9SS type A sorting domain-containing protein [Psychroserpens ponticola]|uniref:T9SS type A sorting domain-containing protein n=1 Tax=Psychroserpens ponticola TaxID=2932268 RepID=A0ABY7RWS2_9FLAO|nr:T9SS type A sorting domain-containing protein [Psychroserpens ponticola]WCO01384.1 T9SS type A sorting domain-containing protein [Psychroserpens ponticola]